MNSDALYYFSRLDRLEVSVFYELRTANAVSVLGCELFSVLFKLVTRVAVITKIEQETAQKLLRGFRHRHLSSTRNLFRSVHR
jgi:hypothetical protein